MSDPQRRFLYSRFVTVATSHAWTPTHWYMRYTFYDMVVGCLCVCGVHRGTELVEDLSVHVPGETFPPSHLPSPLSLSRANLSATDGSEFLYQLEGDPGFVNPEAVANLFQHLGLATSSLRPTLLRELQTSVTRILLLQRRLCVVYLYTELSMQREILRSHCGRHRDSNGP